MQICMYLHSIFLSMSVLKIALKLCLDLKNPEEGQLQGRLQLYDGQRMVPLTSCLSPHSAASKEYGGGRGGAVLKV